MHRHSQNQHIVVPRHHLESSYFSCQDKNRLEMKSCHSLTRCNDCAGPESVFNTETLMDLRICVFLKGTYKKETLLHNLALYDFGMAVKFTVYHGTYVSNFYLHIETVFALCPCNFLTNTAASELLHRPCSSIKVKNKCQICNLKCTTAQNINPNNYFSTTSVGHPNITIT